MIPPRNAKGAPDLSEKLQIIQENKMKTESMKPLTEWQLSD